MRHYFMEDNGMFYRELSPIDGDMFKYDTGYGSRSIRKSEVSETPEAALDKRIRDIDASMSSLRSTIKQKHERLKELSQKKDIARQSATQEPKPAKDSPWRSYYATQQLNEELRFIPVPVTAWPGEYVIPQP